MDNRKKYQIPLLLSLTIILLSALTGYTLSQIPYYFYMELMLLLSYKWLLILSLIIILSLIVILLFIINFYNTNIDTEKSPVKKNNSESNNLSDKELKKIQKNILENLSPDEKDLLSKYFENNTKTLNFSMHDGTVMNLRAQGILFIPSITARGWSMSTAFSMQPWAWEYLNKNQQLLR